MVEKRKNRELFVVLIFLLSLVLFLLAFYLKSAPILDEKEIDVRIEISNVTGLKMGSDLLDFGRIIPGSNGNKIIVLTNNYTFPIFADFEATGDVKDFLVYNKRVALEPNEVKSASISTITFSDEPFGEYSGILKVIFRRQ